MPSSIQRDSPLQSFLRPQGHIQSWISPQAHQAASKWHGRRTESPLMSLDPWESLDLLLLHEQWKNIKWTGKQVSHQNLHELQIYLSHISFFQKRWSGRYINRFGGWPLWEYGLSFQCVLNHSYAPGRNWAQDLDSVVELWHCYVIC